MSAIRHVLIASALACCAAFACAALGAGEERGASDARELVDVLTRGPRDKVKPLFDILAGNDSLEKIATGLEAMVRPEDVLRLREAATRLIICEPDYLVPFFKHLLAEGVANRADVSERPWRVQVAQGALHLALRRLNALPVPDRAKVAGRVGGEIGLGLLYEACKKDWPDEATAALAACVPKGGNSSEWQNFSLALSCGLGCHKEEREKLRPAIAALEARALELTAQGSAPRGGDAGEAFRQVTRMLCTTALPLSNEFKAEMRSRNSRCEREHRLPVGATILACDGDASAVPPLLAMLDSPAPDDRLGAANMLIELARYAWRTKLVDPKTNAAYPPVRLASLCAYQQNAAVSAHFRKWWAEGGSKMSYDPAKKSWLKRTDQGDAVSDPWESLHFGEPGKGPEAGAKFGTQVERALDAVVTRKFPHTVAGAMLQAFADEYGLYLVVATEAPAGAEAPIGAEVREVKQREVLEAACASCRVRFAPLKDSERGLLLLADEAAPKAMPLNVFGPALRKVVQRNDKVRTKADVSKFLGEVAAEVGVPGVILAGYPRRLQKEETLSGEKPAIEFIAQYAELVGAAAGVRGRMLVIEAPLTRPEEP